MNGKNWRIVFFSFSLFMIISIACSFTAPKPIQEILATATPNIPLPPMIVETDPPLGSVIALAQPITFYFNQPMDKPSVEASLSFPVTGSVMWSDDATMIFIPAEPLQPGIHYQFGFSNQAKAANGLAFTQAVLADFTAAPNPHLTQFLPEADMTGVSATAAVVASFDQPMVPLGGGSDPAALPAAFTLSPGVAGKGEWINTSTYIFHPETAFAGGTTYTATINAELLSTAGAPLLDQPAWSFTTDLPRIISFYPSTETPWDLDQTVEIVFNQPMDRASVEAAFVFTDPNGTRVPGDFSWDKNGEKLIFKPAALLARATIYNFGLTTAGRGLGGSALESGLQATIITWPDFALASTDPVNGSVKETDYGPVYFNFSAPLQDGILDEFVRISPEPPQVYIFNSNQTQLGVSVSPFEPAKTYTVTISGDLADKWGQKLGRAVTLQFSTGNADPVARLPLYSRSTYTVRPEAPAINVQSINVTGFDIFTAPLPLAHFLELHGPNAYELQQNYQAAGLIQWSAPGNTALNKNETLTLPLTPDGSDLPTGVYYLWATASGYMVTVNPNNFNASADPALARGGRNPQNIDNPNFFVISNIDATLKVGNTDALVWAVDARTQKPLAGSAVTLYDNGGMALASGNTDANGLWYTAIPMQEEGSGIFFAVISQPGAEDFALAMSNWNTGVSPWDFDVSVDLRGTHPEVYLYTDRPIYRPGQTVYLRGILRDLFDARYTIPTTKQIDLQLYTTSGGDPTIITLPISDYGTFNGSYTIPEDAQPGAFSINADGYRLYFNFQVADYRKPEINLSVELTPENLKQGDLLKGTINAQYFFGAPVGDVEVEWHLYHDTHYFYLPSYLVGGCKDANIYCYYGDGYTGYYGTQVAQGTATTGADGRAAIEFDDETRQYILENSGRYTLEVTVRDESGFPVSARAASTIHAESYYIGVRPEAWVGQAKTPMNFNIYTAGWDQAPSGSHKVEAEFASVKWTRKDNGNGFYTLVPASTKVDSKSITTDGDGRAALSFTPKTGGTYLLKLISGNAFTSILIWVGGADSAAWPQLPDQQIRLVADQTTYKPGQTAQVYVPNPFDVPVQALVTLERGKIRDAKVYTIDKGGSTISITLGEIDAPNIYFAATLLAPNGDFRVGYINLPVAADAQKLKVEVISQPERSEPGGEVKFSVRVTDANGQPAQGEFSLAVVDLAALALADPNSPDIFPAFYDIQPLGIRSGFTAAVSATRGMQTPAGGKGGGGGDGAISVARENFPDTAYWNATILTDADGRAEVSLKLPDNLTTWYVDVRGLTRDTRVGQATLEVVSTKPLLIRPVTPRFFVVGDHVELAAVVNNNTAGVIAATVMLQVKGFKLDNDQDAAQKISIPANGRVRVAWRGTAEDAAAAELIFSVEGGGLQDATKPTWGDLPILHYTAPQTFTTAGILSDAGSALEIVSLPRSYAPTGGALNVELSPSAIPSPRP